MNQINQTVGYIKNITSVYKKNEDKFDLVLKVLAGLFVFGRIAGLAGGNLGTSKIVFLTLICVVLTLIVSPNLFLIMMGLVSCLYIAAISVESALIVFCVFFLIYVFYVRIFPKESLIIPVMLAAYFFKIPYIVPIIVGLYIGIKGIGAIIITVFLQNSKELLDLMIQATPKQDFDLMGMLDGLITILEVIAGNISTQWIYIAGVFVLATICVWAISRLSINNERVIAIMASGAVLLIGVFICKAVAGADVSIIGAIIGVPLSCAVAYVFNFYDFVLDYGKTEHVKFQDDNFMYYVKAVPKIKR